MTGCSRRLMHLILNIAGAFLLAFSMLAIGFLGAMVVNTAPVLLLPVFTVCLIADAVLIYSFYFLWSGEILNLESQP